MHSVAVCVDPETTIDKSKEIMEVNKIDCLPIIENEELIGIFTRKDLESVIQKQQML